VFYENFDDGDYISNPDWELGYGGNVYVSNGTLFHDGTNDGSGRYWSILNSFVNFSTKDKLIFSIKGLLNSQGNPQEGRGIILSIGGNNNLRYDLRIQDGFTSGFPINQYSISLGYGTGSGLYDYISTAFAPQRDLIYYVKAIREKGQWLLYVNDYLIGSATDIFNITYFNIVHAPLVGSVSIYEVNVTVDLIEEEPQANPLLSKFAPVLYLHPDEYYEPKDITSLMDYSNLRKTPNELVKQAPIITEDIDNLEESKDHFLDMAIVDINEDYALPNPEAFSNYEAKIYGRIVEDENHYKHLQYFIFYPFQNWYVMKHEGDWEMVQVTLNPAEKIDSVSYFFDLFTMVYYDKELITFIENTHPVVYVGKGSHNNFADDKLIEFSDENLFFLNFLGRIKEIEKIKIGGKELKPHELPLEEANEINYNLEEIFFGTPWIKYEGRWGQTSDYYFSNGPKGPKHNPSFADKWKHPEELTYAPNLPFFGVFLYSPLDIELFNQDNNKIEWHSKNVDIYTGKDTDPEAAIVTGIKNSTVKLTANEEGQFTLEIYYYDNETNQGIIVRYENISNTKNTKGKLQISKESNFILFLDNNNDEVYEKKYLPSRNLTYNRFTYSLPDEDKDGVTDVIDNCVNIYNIDQADFNSDEKGDACDNPNYYKEQAVDVISRLIPESQREKVMLKIAMKAIQESLDPKDWQDDFSIKNRRVFIKEVVATLHLQSHKEILKTLTKADALIIEKKLCESTANKRYPRAKELYTYANKLSDEEKYVKAILTYAEAWELLNNKA